MGKFLLKYKGILISLKIIVISHWGSKVFRIMIYKKIMKRQAKVSGIKNIKQQYIQQK